MGVAVRERSGGGAGMELRSQLFAVKPVAVLLAEMEGENRLRRVLGPVSLTALGVGAIIGAGIFVLTGLAAHEKAGPGLILSFVVAGTGSYCNLAAALIVLLVTVVLVIGIRESAGFNSAMVILKLVIVLFVIGVGATYVRPQNWHPFLPFGWHGVMQGASYVFFAYIGFDSVSTHAEEARNPQRDVPIGIIASLGLCTVLYILVAAVLTGMVPYTEIDIHAPVAAAFASRGLGVAQFIISLGAVIGITSVLLVLLLSQARVLLAMARDGLIPREFFAAVHPRFRTPHKATILTGILVAIVSAVFPLRLLAELVNIGTLMAFVIVCAAVMVMRRTNPQLPRPFRTPLVPLVPILGMGMNFALMCSLGWGNWKRLIGWLLIGLVIYFLYGRKRSTMALQRAAASR